MIFRLLITLGLVLALASCGNRPGGQLNPLNWFGGEQNVRVPGVETRVVADPRGLVAQVVSLRVERAPGGAIVRATGLPQRQGYWDGELVQEPATEPGVLAFQFRISPPPGATPAGPPRSREVVVARFVSEQTLAGIRVVVVRGAANALQSRR